MRRHQQDGADAHKQINHMSTINTTAAIIMLISLTALIAVVAAFISALLEELENWRMRAERFEELYYDEVESNMKNTLQQ